MSDHCVRSITFEIPGKNANHGGVQVYAEEHDGTIVFTIQSLGGDDIRGFFFHLANESLLGGLQFSGLDPSIVETRVGRNNVIDMGNGANMKGAVKEGFDVGLEFGTPGAGHNVISGPVSFTLSHATQDLTLDDIAHVLFGARMTSSGAKIVEVSPAAPDAIDDDFNIFEDGQSGLNDPSHIPEAVLFDVLANDTDADGDTLQITDAYGALHGTVQVIDDPDGDYILYTPDADYSGTDSFTYCVYDGDGGTDFAVVDIVVQAVADIPDIDVEVIASDVVNQFILRVSAAQTDLDLSEYIDEIFFTGALPPGVTIVPQSAENPGTEPNSLQVDYLVTLPLGEDTSFTVDFTAVAREESNGDTQTATESVDIEFTSTTANLLTTFSATDQSMWDTGDQFEFDDNRFIGVDTGTASSGSVLDGFVDYSAGVDLRIGFQSNLHFEGGEIDAELAYDLTVDTNYNRTTDQLLISSSADLTGANFQTEGPGGTYTLDFILDFFAFANVDLDFGDLGTWTDVIDVNLAIDPADLTLLDLDSDNLGFELPLPLGFSINFAWPNIETSTSEPPGDVVVTVTNGASNNFLQFNMDVDQFFADLLLGGANPLNPEITVGIPEVLSAYAGIDFLDFDVNAGMNFLQEFMMTVQNLDAVLHFEDGSTRSMTWGDDILIDDASTIDAAGDADGEVEFFITLNPDVDLQNDTDLGINVGYNLDVLRFYAGYDIILVDSDEISIGPLIDLGGSLQVATVDVYDETFDLAFQGQQWNGLTT